MKVLIVGGSGLISTQITHQLLERDDEVTLFNRGITPLAGVSGIQVVRGSRTDYPRFEERIAELGSFDCVIDMLCFTPEDARSAVRASTSGRTGRLATHQDWREDHIIRARLLVTGAPGHRTGNAVNQCRGCVTADGLDRLVHGRQAG